MTEPENSSISNSTEPEDRASEDMASDDIVMNDAAPPTRSASNPTTGNQLGPSVTSTSTRNNIILHFPPEIRVMIYRYLLRLPGPLPYYLPILWRLPSMRALTGLLHTCRVIRGESLNILHGENTFFVDQHCIFPLQRVTPSRRIGDMIQNFSIDVQLWTESALSSNEFINIVDAFTGRGAGMIIRGTFRINFYLHRSDHDFRRRPLLVFLRRLGRLTNFRVVEIDIGSYRGRSILNAAMQDCIDRCYECVEHGLRFALGPTSPPRARGQGLIFHPQLFLNPRPSRLGGIRLHGNGDETYSDQNTDQNADQNGGQNTD